MANIKSSIKRISVTKTKQAQNKPIKTRLANEIKKFQAALQANELKHAEAQLSVVFSVLDAAATDNVIHANKANRQKSKLASQLHQAQTKGKGKTAAKAVTAVAPKAAAPKEPVAPAENAAAKPAAKTTTKATPKKSA